MPRTTLPTDKGDATPERKIGGASGNRPGTFKPGADPRRGKGKRKRSGRKSKDFIQECSDLVDGVVLEKVNAFLHRPRIGPTSAAWRWCSEFAAKYVKVEAKKILQVEGLAPPAPPRPAEEIAAELVGIIDLTRERAKRTATG